MNAVRSLPSIASNLMRSLFFVKKTRAALDKVSTLQADVIVLDLEDSIEKSEKVNVRELYKNALKDNLFGSSKVFVRSSSLSCYEDVCEDIDTFTGTGIRGFMLPKINYEDEVKTVEDYISRVEREKGLTPMQTKLIPIIESLPAYFALDKIAVASRRNVGIIGGSGDFISEALCEDHSDTYDLYFSKIVLAARCAGIQPLWGVCDKIDDHAGFYNTNNKMKRNGFCGSAALTPKQIMMANAIYSLSPREAEWIRSVRNNGSNIKVIQPSVQESRQMIGPPHRVKAENMLKHHGVDRQPIARKAPSTVKRSVNGLSKDVKIGEIRSTPSEFVMTNGMINMWDSAFLKYQSNSPQAELPGHAPFSLSTTLAVSSSVQCFSYCARAHLGFKNIFQVRPLSAGERVRAIFRIDDVLLKKGSDSNSYAVANSKHWLVNQRDEVVLQLDKATMFCPRDCSPKTAAVKNVRSLNFEDSLLFTSALKSTSDAENSLPLIASSSLLAGDVMVHDIVKVMGNSEVRMLCYLLKIVNPHHHNIIRYNHTDILVPGPFVMAAAISNASFDLGGAVYEDILKCINPNKVNLGDQIGTLTFIEKCSAVESNPHLEEVILKHVAVKNTDMDTLASSVIPPELFADNMKPSEYEQLCIEKMPQLIHKIVCVVTRRVFRVRGGLKRTVTVPCELEQRS